MAGPLLKAKANVNAKEENGDTATMWASREGHKEVVQLLLKAKADVNAKNEYGMTAIKWASNNGYMEIVQLLESHKELYNI